MTTVAQNLAQTLVDAGVTRVFGLPGGENAELLDALRQAEIDFVLVRNEASALYMADATARLTGTPGVALTTLGPGATNAYAGLAHAWLDRAPVLLITAQSPSDLIGRHTHQVLDLQAIFRPITKSTVTLTPHNPQAVRDALNLAVAGRPGPVHLGLASDVASQPVEVMPITSQPAIEHEQSSMALSAATLEAAQRQLTAAQRPVIVVGLGLEPERPYAPLRDFADALDAPVITTPKAKGALPADHPLAAGTIGLTRTDPVYEILDEADCVVAIGFDVVELVKPWSVDTPLIWVAGWPNIDPTLEAEAELVGPVAPALEQLANLDFQIDSGWGKARVAAHRKRLAARSLPMPAPDRLLPQAVLRALREHLPRGTLLATDVGSHKIFAALEWPAFVPNRYLVSNGLSCMGFGLPTAIAACLALDEPTVCLTGDAGLAMVLGELSLLAERELPVTVVVMNDSALDLIRSAQARAGKPAYGTEFTNPDFTAIARAYGLDAHRVASEADCAKAVQAAVASRRPTLIEALIDPVGYPTTVATSN